MKFYSPSVGVIIFKFKSMTHKKIFTIFFRKVFYMAYFYEIFHITSPFFTRFSNRRTCQWLYLGIFFSKKLLFFSTKIFHCKTISIFLQEDFHNFWQFSSDKRERSFQIEIHCFNTAIFIEENLSFLQRRGIGRKWSSFKKFLRKSS